ncbi:GNAT family N-acetyltransferase [Microbacterium amylolyticum]|uniref:GNAT superfamily N-acetyltransferase n=1 Tax=Microbacterium amylolyticum TaxID=936337 RepID=A0ABS4ZF52_9MICO|nr:GNAT family N-acetyltransferase [Microbacterium amylolyticum]MBP2435913.1 GNAT superfamily N-acetyltransferase [Microbacterium amylolyticum]
MRLTNVAHMRLPFGRLWGYHLAPGESGQSLPVSFDQRRHVSAGDRPGSWMALSLRLPDPVDREALSAAWMSVISRHGTLRTAFRPDDAGIPVLEEIQVAEGTWEEHPIAPGEAVNEALGSVLDRFCTSYSRPSHRLCVLETATDSTVVIGADHAHVDMWSMLVIARDLLRALAEPGVEYPPVLPFADHTAALRERPDAPEDLRGRWREILEAGGDVMPRFPLPLGSEEPHPERVEVRDVFDVDDSAAFSVQAQEEGTSTLSLAVSAMTQVTQELAGASLRAVFPVHSRYDATWHDSVGWFITNSVIESRDPDPKACASAVKEAVRLGSVSLEDVLEPWGGMPEAPGMFAISWLDLRRLPVHVDSVGLEAQYVGARIRTDGVMLWFVLDGSGVHLRCRYPDTPEARTNVGKWLDLLVARMRQLARESARGRLRLGERIFRVQRAIRADVRAVIDLLPDDELRRTRETGESAAYEAAYDLVSRDGSHFLAVVRDESDALVGTMQLTVIPGLVRSGATRLQIEGFRVRADVRGEGLGSRMLEWAHDYGRARGATLAQVATDEARERARPFYTGHGYEASHVGFKKQL